MKKKTEAEVSGVVMGEATHIFYPASSLERKMVSSPENVGRWDSSHSTLLKANLPCGNILKM